jgi:hypothetical protein
LAKTGSALDAGLPADERQAISDVEARNLSVNGGLVHWDPSASLHVIKATGPPTTTAPARHFFFFHGAKFLGTDASFGANDYRESFAWRTSNTVAINYPLFQYSYDPSAPLTEMGSVKIRFRWTGSRLVRLDPLPAFNEGEAMMMPQ